MFDRSRAEALNSDHHRRMSEDVSGKTKPEADRIAGLDKNSRKRITKAMLGCSKRHGLRRVDPKCKQCRGFGRFSPFDEQQTDGRDIQICECALNQVLEIGAGRGGDRNYLVDRLEGEYTGIELVTEVAAEAIAEVSCLALEDASSEWDGRFHYVYSRHVMEHMLDVDLACRTIKRLLAPNGIVGAVTPHYFPDPEPAHVSQLRLEEWMAVYRRNGLKPAYAIVEHHACEEAHIVAVHEEWSLES